MFFVTSTSGEALVHGSKIMHCSQGIECMISRPCIQLRRGVLRQQYQWRSSSARIEDHALLQGYTVQDFRDPALRLRSAVYNWKFHLYTQLGPKNDEFASTERWPERESQWNFQLHTQPCTFGPNFPSGLNLEHL